MCGTRTWTGTGVEVGSYGRRGGDVVGYAFHPSRTRLLTAERMRTVGLDLGKLEELSVELLRLSATGKWHVADAGGDYRTGCQHLDRLRYNAASRERATTQKVPLLGNYDLCSGCAHRFGLRGPAGLYFRAAGLIDQAHTWVEELEKGAGRFDWLAYSRWTSCTPFGEPDQLAALLAGLTGARGWAKPRERARTVWVGLRDRAEAAWQSARQAAGPPGFRTRAATVRDSLSRDRQILTEASSLNGVAGYALYGGVAPDPWTYGSHAWLRAVAADANPAAGRRALATTLDRLYHDLPARDLTFLPKPAAHSGAGFCCPAHWADAEFHTMRHTIAEMWADRLELELHDDTEAEGERLLLVVGWPLVSEGAREIAYIVQYPVIAQGPDLSIEREGRRSGQAAVLRVPAAAARHAAHASARHGEFWFELAEQDVVDDSAALALLRRVSMFLAEECEQDPAPFTPAPATADARARANRHRSPEFEQWRADPQASVYGLRYAWSWTPEDDAELEADQFALLDRLMRGHMHHEMTFTVMAGPFPDLQEESFNGYLERVDPDGHQIYFRTGQSANTPAYQLPLRRLISLHPAW